MCRCEVVVPSKKSREVHFIHEQREIFAMESPMMPLITSINYNIDTCCLIFFKFYSFFIVDDTHNIWVKVRVYTGK